jgi:hypothetical protein
VRTLLGKVVVVADGTVEVVELGTGRVKVNTVGEARVGILMGDPLRRIWTPLGEPMETEAPSASGMVTPPCTGTVAAYNVVDDPVPVICTQQGEAGCTVIA